MVWRTSLASCWTLDETVARCNKKMQQLCSHSSRSHCTSSDLSCCASKMESSVWHKVCQQASGCFLFLQTLRQTLMQALATFSALLVLSPSLSPLLLQAEKANNCMWFCRLYFLIPAFVSISPSVSRVLGLHSADHGMSVMRRGWPPQMRKRSALTASTGVRGLREVHASDLLENKQESVFRWLLTWSYKLVSENLGVLSLSHSGNKEKRETDPNSQGEFHFS